MNGDLVAETEFGWLYIISETYPGGREPFVLFTAPSQLTLKRPHESMEDAKNCAQEDLNRRLRLLFGRQAKYRMVDQGDEIQKGDEELSQDCTAWEQVTDLVIGCRHCGNDFRPIRRPVGQE
ncbi:hypothetical protein [Sulfitobacter sp. R18_1]|uniref:hypothetical protein n=1 Tax=Sulfitobacter sp. R18_1 TaxID=2821104 RepID=UPI001AD969AE|nr:hypothetical protein [Sulfitobacter sp. R18_1]MBO9428274.1 hypothetical protein [Sulfitobacter sp. R18_1]